MNIETPPNVKHEQGPNMLEIRQSTDEDIDLMYRLQNLDGTDIDPTNPKQQEQLVAYRDNFDASKIQVIEIDKAPVGRLRVVRDETIYIGGIQVLPEYRGQGIGTKILLGLITEAEKTEKKVTLEVFHNNENALNLYERLGFVVADENEQQKIMEYIPKSIN